jgi:nucleotide-binding universal stress UspA family protein
LRQKALIKKMLVAVDGSANSERALDFALNLAEKYGSSILILNVFQLPTFYESPEEPPVYSASRADYIKDLQQMHENTLARAAAKARTLKPGLEIAAEMRKGEPAAQIVRAAKEGGFDLIVVGHKGWSRMREIFLGGTSERVAHMAECAVLIVK